VAEGPDTPPPPLAGPWVTLFPMAAWRGSLARRAIVSPAVSRSKPRLLCGDAEGAPRGCTGRRTTAYAWGMATPPSPSRITVEPGKCGGRPCVRHMRIRVKDVLEMLAAGASEDQILADYPDLERGDIRACLEYAAQYFDHPVVLGG